MCATNFRAQICHLSRFRATLRQSSPMLAPANSWIRHAHCMFGFPLCPHFARCFLMGRLTSLSHTRSLVVTALSTSALHSSQQTTGQLSNALINSCSMLSFCRRFKTIHNSISCIELCGSQCNTLTQVSAHNQVLKQAITIMVRYSNIPHEEAFYEISLIIVISAVF